MRLRRPSKKIAIAHEFELVPYETDAGPAPFSRCQLATGLWFYEPKNINAFKLIKIESELKYTYYDKGSICNHKGSRSSDTGGAMNNWRTIFSIIQKAAFSHLIIENNCYDESDKKENIIKTYFEQKFQKVWSRLWYSKIWPRNELKMRDFAAFARLKSKNYM